MLWLGRRPASKHERFGGSLRRAHSAIDASLVRLLDEARLHRELLASKRRRSLPRLGFHEKVFGELNLHAGDGSLHGAQIAAVFVVPDFVGATIKTANSR